jgi:hypothetical protein
MKLITRHAWGARAPKFLLTTLASTHGVKVHFTGDRVAPGVVGDHDRCFDMVRAIQDFHMDTNDWNDIAYSFLVCTHGYVFEGRGLHHEPAANGAGLNRGHYAVCGLVGNSGLVDPSDAMLNGIRDAIEYCRTEGDAGNEIKGHRDGYSTDCPGPKLYAWVKAGAPRPGGLVRPPVWNGRLLKLTSPMMRGADVGMVQTWLNDARDEHAAPIAVDLVYGPATKRAVERYQAIHHGLTVDGIVGRWTWESLAR